MVVLTSGCLQDCHLSSTSKFPDFSLIFSRTFYSFPYPLTDQKKIFFIPYFNGVKVNCITSSLGVTLKGKNLLKGANSFL